MNKSKLKQEKHKEGIKQLNKTHANEISKDVDKRAIQTLKEVARKKLVYPKEQHSEIKTGV